MNSPCDPPGYVKPIAACPCQPDEEEYMKNIQVFDGAVNAVCDIFAATDAAMKKLPIRTVQGCDKKLRHTVICSGSASMDD